MLTRSPSPTITKERAREVAASLKSSESSRSSGSSGSSRIAVKQIDVNDSERLAQLVRGSDVVLSAVEYVFNLPILKACIQEKVHYADLGGLFHMTRKLMDLHTAAEAAGITAILGMGGTPGVTNLLAQGCR
jgi:saccharopine dehydrogenase-like NADP-dependent oxidoreductase